MADKNIMARIGEAMENIAFKKKAKVVVEPIAEEEEDDNKPPVKKAVADHRSPFKRAVDFDTKTKKALDEAGA